MNPVQPVAYNYAGVPTLPPGWAEHRTPIGQPYWYNTVTRQSSWVFPIYQAPVVAVTPTPKKKQTKKKIPGTHWLFVLTHDGYEFFYDRETKTSVWEMPEELKEPMALLMKQEEEEKENKKRAAQEEQEQEAKRIKLEQEEQQQKEEQPNESIELTEDDILWQLQQMEEEQVTEEPISQEQTEEEQVQRQLEQEQEQIEQHFLQQQQQQPIEEKPKEKNQVPEEEITRRFYELLKERNISPFSVYSMEYPSLMSDPRFTLVPHNKQKALFNKYCHELGEKLKNEKKNKKKPEDEFKELLEQKVTVKMYWDDFRRKYKQDPRFKAMTITKEKEAMFKDHVKHLGINKNKSPTEEYLELLSDTKEIRVGMRWRDAKRLLEKDPRYHAIESKTEREDLYRDYLETLQ